MEIDTSYIRDKIILSYCFLFYAVNAVIFLNKTKLKIHFIRKATSACGYVVTFCKWVLIAFLTGAVGGLIGSAFDKSVELVTGLNTRNSWLLYLLPVGGVVIVLLYQISKIPDETGTNHVIDSIRSDKGVPLLLAPLIFISTVITHLFGGSAGREGAALQLGGSIGSQVGKILHLDEKDMHLVIMCGMSGVFASLFGTPLTATLFAMEVISVGVIYYSGIVPCIVSSLTAYGVSILFGISPIRFNLKTVPGLSVENILRVAGLAALCAVVSILFCLAMKGTEKFLKKFFKNQYLRIIAGGAAIILLTLLVGTRDYNGIGISVIDGAILDGAEAFLLKIVFTAVTIGAGFKGGEIVPTLFIGSTFGCVAGGLLGLDSGFAAAVGLVALFCGVVNCPIASFILSIELFGAQGMVLFAVACAVSYMLSGYYGLYSSQKIMYSKLKAEFININTK